MKLSELFNYVLYMILTTILPVIATYAVNLIKAKIKESTTLEKAAKNEMISNLIKDALSDIMDAVLHVNQIYTDSLKASGCFDDAAKKEAFNRAYVEAMNMISDEAKDAVTQAYGSFDKWLKLKLEASVNLAKKG